MSSFESIGGDEVVGRAVETFYEKLTADPALADFFESADVAGLKTHQRMFLTAALGGPDAYEGRDMRAAHAHLDVSDTDFDLFLEHLAETLVDVGATPERVAELLERLSVLRLEIVRAPSDGPDQWGSQDPSGGSG